MPSLFLKAPGLAVHYSLSNSSHLSTHAMFCHMNKPLYQSLHTVLHCKAWGRAPSPQALQ